MFLLLLVLASTLFFNVIRCEQIEAKTKTQDQALAKKTFTRTRKNSSINCIRKLFDNFHSVERGVLYRSKQLSKKRLEKYIKRLDLKTIINLRGPNPTRSWWRQEKALAQKHGLKFYNLAMTARSLPSKQHLLKLLDIYKTAPKPILIHCYSGADRTGEAAALWVLEHQKKHKNIALKQLSFKYGYVRSKHPAKHFFISIWQGKKWLTATYDPDIYPKCSQMLI